MKFWQVVVLIAFIAAIGIGISIWQPWKTSSRNITISGEGKVKSTPDVARIQGGVQTKKATTAEAQAETSTKMSKIIDVLKEKGIAEKDIKTEQISAYPNYVYDLSKTTTDGYIARTTITVTVREIGKGQEILDLLTANGATDLYGPNLTFSDEKLEQLKTEARGNAVKNAREKANQLASAGNTKVGKVISISEGSFSGGTPIPYYAKEAVSSPDNVRSTSSTIQPGEDEVTIQVSVTYGLR